MFSTPGIATVLTSLLLVGASGAAAGAPSSEEPIDEIQVTATRRPVSVSDVSAAVTLIDADELSGAKLVTDALAAKPGMFLQQTTPGQGAAIVRGLKGSEILHLVDGLRMNNAIFRNAPTQYLALVSPATVERIEVLRGSPASLYGSDAVGGVVQVVNRMPDFTAGPPGWRREFGVSIDSAEQQRAAQVALDAGNETVAGLVSMNFLDTGNRRIGGGERIAPTGYSARAFRAALVVTPDEQSRWLVDLQHGRQPKTPRIDELVAGFGQSEPASAEFYFEPNERSFAHLGYRRSDGAFGADWNADLGWQRIVDDRRTRAFGDDIRRLEDNSSDLFGLTVTASGDHRAGGWIAGVEVYHDEVGSRRRELDLGSGDVVEVVARFPDGSTVDQAAAFVNGDFDLAARHRVSAGLRASSVRIDLTATPVSLPAGVDVGDWSGDIGWRFAYSDALQFVANLGFGFRAPNVFDLGTLGERPGNRFNVPNPGLDAEHIVQADIGMRFSGERLSAAIIAWRFDYRDRITSVLTGGQTADGRDIVQTQNRTSAELWGVEGQARLQIGERATAELVLNYTRGEQADAEGMPEPADRVPPLNGRLGVELFVGTEWTLEPYVVFAAEQDRLSARDAGDPRIDPEGTDGWATLNLEARWRGGERWFLRFAAGNLLDERYRFHGSGLDAPGQNIGVDLRYVW